MKSINYSCNSSLLVDFMLLWHLKMEGISRPAQSGAFPQTHESWWKADNALRTAFSHMINLPLYLAHSKEIYWRELKEISHSG